MMDHKLNNRLPFFASIIFFFLLFIQVATHAKTTDEATNVALDKTLATLVSFKTIPSDTNSNQQALDWVQKQLEGLPLYFKKFQSNGRPSLVITTKNTKSPKLWLVAHMDVVPADEQMFTMQTKDNKLHGRGVLDMKLGIAYYITLLKSLGASLKDYDIGIMLTSDEEVGGMDGVRYLLENQGYSGKFGFLPDGGFDWKIEEQAKGILWIKFKVKGLASHGSRPWLGVNAINNLILILNQVNAYFDNVKNVASEKDFYTTVNLGLISGGKAANQSPDYAEATVDIRYTPSFDLKQFTKDLNNIISKVPQASYEILVEGPPNHLDLNLPQVKLFVDIAKQMGVEVGKTRSHGATDARFFSGKGIPVMIVSPHGADIHSPTEWVDQNDYHRLYQVFKTWALQVGRD